MNQYYSDLWKIIYSKPHPGRIHEIRAALREFDQNYSLDEAEGANKQPTGAAAAFLIVAIYGAIIGFIIGYFVK